MKTMNRAGIINTKKYSGAEIEPIIRGDRDLPNFERMDIALVVNNIAAVGHGLEPAWGYSKINGRKAWTQYFLSNDGSGYVLIWNSAAPITGRFWLCRHEAVEDPGANHARGWHPAHCKHCGLNMSVDSGD